MRRHNKIPAPGDIYWIDPNPVAGHEIKNGHRFVVITPQKVNAQGLSTTVPITSGGNFSRNLGFTVPILCHETNGVALCNQVRSFDISAREAKGSARYLETLDEPTTHSIISRVLSLIDPET